MKTEDIVRMAEQAGLCEPKGFLDAYDQLEKFAKLVAAAEREACAKLCWSKSKYWDAEACADAIRARGQA